MLILATRHFYKWRKKQKILAYDLVLSANELEQGLWDAKLGAALYKKRIKINKRGKRAGARVIIYYKFAHALIYCHGFCKNETANLSAVEYEGFRKLAKIFSSMNKQQLSLAIEKGNLVELNS